MKLQGPDNNRVSLCRPHRVSSVSPHSPSVRPPTPSMRKHSSPETVQKQAIGQSSLVPILKLIFSVTKLLTLVDGYCFGR